MLRQLFITCLVAVLPIAAHATSTASIINTSCSGNLTSSLVDGASFACAGNLTLDGGFITSDSVINISADGDLFLDNLTLTSPNINLSVLTGILKTGNNLLINANSNITFSAVIFKHDQVSKNLDYDKGLKIEEQNNTNLFDINPSSSSLDLFVDHNNRKPIILIPELTGNLGALVINPEFLTLIVENDSSTPSLILLSPVPEPTTYVMILLGLSLILFKRRTNR